MSGAARSTRSRMSSRRSSPYGNPPKETRSQASETSRDPNKSTNDPWVEPELPQPAPSFVGDKLVRQGVLENMLPLGSLPSAKARQRSRMNGPLRLPTPLRNGTAAVLETPSSANIAPPSPLSNVTRPQSEEENTVSRPFNSRRNGITNEEEDDEYRPASGRRSSNLFVNKSSQMSTPTSAPQFTGRRIRPDVASKAVQELRNNGNFAVAAALEEAFGRTSDPNITRIFDAVITTNSTHEDFSSFKRLIKSLVPSTGKRDQRQRAKRARGAPSDPLSTSPITSTTRAQSSANRAQSPLAEKDFTNRLSSAQSYSNRSDSIDATNMNSIDRVNNGRQLKSQSREPPSLPLSPHTTTTPSNLLHLPHLPQISQLEQFHSPSNDHSGTEAPAENRARSASTSSLSSVPSVVENDASPSPIDSAALADDFSMPPTRSRRARAGQNNQPVSRQAAKEAEKSPSPSVSIETKRAAAAASRKKRARKRAGGDTPDEEALDKRRNFLTDGFKETLNSLKREYSQIGDSDERPDDEKRRRLAEASGHPRPRPPRRPAAPSSRGRLFPPARGRPLPPSTRRPLSASTDSPLTTPLSGDQTSSAVTDAQTSSAAAREPVKASTARNNATGKRSRDEFEAEDGSVSSTPDEPAVATSADELAPASRVDTPKTHARPSKMAKKSARILISPNKKKDVQASVPTAGLPRGAEKKDNSSAGVGEETAQENQDFCASCSGNGTLLCCDGCVRSYHFSCCDPPVNPDNPPAGTWLCIHCDPSPKYNETKSTLFKPLLKALETQPQISAFSLPEEIRHYFEGVKTGEEGEYQPVNNGRLYDRGKPKRKLVDPLDLEPELYQPYDVYGVLNICHGCMRGPEGRRPIIDCDYCAAKWHMDCVNPPLALPPWKPHPEGTSDLKTAQKERERVGWKCPLHVDHDLARISATGRGGPFDEVEFFDDGGDHEEDRQLKIRRPKRPQIVKPALQRGVRNNGLIEIDLMHDDWNHGEITEKDIGGTIYTLPEHGIRLDFIDRAKREREVDAARARWIDGHARRTEAVPSGEAGPSRAGPSQPTSAASGEEVDLTKRPILDLKAALAMTEMAGPNKDSSLSGKDVSGLVNTLISEASPDVVELFSTTSGNAPNLSQGATIDINNLPSLLALQKLIARHIEKVRAAGVDAGSEKAAS